MRNKKNIILTAIAGTLISTSCTNDSTDDLIEKPNLENLSYANDIEPIIRNNCIRCHSNPPTSGAPMSLTTYADVKNAAQTRGLIVRISKQPDDTGMMPKGGPRLPQPSIDKISAWASQGYKE